MAKGKVQHLVSPWTKITVKSKSKDKDGVEVETSAEVNRTPIERNGVTINLTPLEFGRGEGFYPGLVASDDLAIDILENFTAKNKEILEDEVLRPKFFLGQICELFNQAIFNPTWREVTENYTAEKFGANGEKLSEVQKKEIIDAFSSKINSYFSGEKAERQRDSSYYVRKLAEIQDSMKPLIAKAKGDLKNLSQDEQKSYQTLKENFNQTKELRDAKLKEEEELLSSSLELL